MTEENPTDAENEDRHMSQVSLVVYNTDDSQKVLGSYASTTIENGFFYLEKIPSRSGISMLLKKCPRFRIYIQNRTSSKQILGDSYISVNTFPPAFLSVRET
jgi:hypothetical protein